MRFLPGQSFRVNIGPPIPFWDHLVLGERYELLWPGGCLCLVGLGHTPREVW